MKWHWVLFAGIALVAVLAIGLAAWSGGDDDEEQVTMGMTQEQVLSNLGGAEQSPYVLIVGQATAPESWGPQLRAFDVRTGEEVLRGFVGPRRHLATDIFALGEPPRAHICVVLEHRKEWRTQLVALDLDDRGAAQVVRQLELASLVLPIPVPRLGKCYVQGQRSDFEWEYRACSLRPQGAAQADPPIDWDWIRWSLAREGSCLYITHNLQGAPVERIDLHTDKVVARWEIRSHLWPGDIAAAPSGEKAFVSLYDEAAGRSGLFVVEPGEPRARRLGEQDASDLGCVSSDGTTLWALNTLPTTEPAQGLLLRCRDGAVVRRFPFRSRSETGLLMGFFEVGPFHGVGVFSGTEEHPRSGGCVAVLGPAQGQVKYAYFTEFDASGAMLARLSSEQLDALGAALRRQDESR
ncbi:MAG: hypothetical protein ACE5R4_15545 [Armatimonadota bacterium]